jgi:hypothetical protein
MRILWSGVVAQSSIKWQAAASLVALSERVQQRIRPECSPLTDRQRPKQWRELLLAGWRK